MPTVSRAPNVPRKIRDLKPRRQQRNERTNSEWWHDRNEGANNSATKIPRPNSRGLAASNESFDTVRSRFSRANKNVDEPTPNDESEAETDAGHTKHSSILLQGWYKFKSTPTRKKIKRLIAGLVLLTALKSIYFADLDNYQYSHDGHYSYYTSDTQTKPGSSTSSLRGGDDGVKSLSELLGDDYLGDKSGEVKNNKMTGKSMSESIGIDTIQSNSQYSFGRSMSDTMGSSSGQNFGSLESNNSNHMQSSSYNSLGRSMSDTMGLSSGQSFGSFESNNSNNMQSSSYNSLGRSISESESMGSSSSQNFGSLDSNKSNSIHSSSYNSLGRSMSESMRSSSGQNFGSLESNNESIQSSSYNSLGRSMSDTMGLSSSQSFGSFASNNGNNMQSSSYNSLGRSISDTMGLSSSQSFGSLESNDSSIQSSSYNSLGRSMPDSMRSSSGQSFGSFESNNNNGKNRQSAPSNAFAHHSSGFQTNDNKDVYNSYSSQVNDSIQHSLSHSGQYQQRGLALGKASNSQSASGSTGEYQGLRSLSMNGAANLMEKGTDKSMSSVLENGVSNNDHTLDNLQRPINDIQHNLASMKDQRNGRCSLHGGPYSAEEYSELIYWRNDELDDSFTSPFYDPNNTSFYRAKYLTFEMDWSGWNNARLGFENMMVLAHSMGRTLVMPPKRQIAHGMPDIHGRKIVSFDDFYDIDAISVKQNGLSIISMEEFLSREAVTGNLKSMTTDEVMYPPNNQVNWQAQRLEPLWDYITKVSRTFNWKPKECVLAFPAKAGADDQHLFSMMADVLIEKDGRPFPNYSEFQGKPVSVDAPTIERFREILAGRRKICMYDWDMHIKNDVVHFKAEENEERLILPYYAFMFFEDWRQQTFAMRFVRDKLVYNDAIICLASRIVNTIRDHVRQHNPENNDGQYDAIHIRRADFQSQFPLTEMDANTILAGIEDEIQPGSTVYVSTDERDPGFFEPLRAVYDLKFIGDFGDMLKGVNPQYFGLAEQIICSRSRIFFGTYFSSFSAYIVRLRGYYSARHNLPGQLPGSLQNTYYLPTKWKKEMTIYQAVHVPFYAREFPIAWRDIDKR